MKIIILEGSTQKGKTTTLGMVFISLLINGYSLNSFKSLNKKTDFDFKAELYNSAKDNIKVAVFTSGDSTKQVNPAIRKYSKTMDVLVIACSTPKTNPFIPQGNNVIRITKTVAASKMTEGKANAKDARNILKNI